MATRPSRTWGSGRPVSTRAQRADRTRLALLTAWLAILAAVVLATGSLSAHHLKHQLAGHGVLGPIIFIAASSALTVAFFPGPVLAGASGLLFGTALGTPVSIAAATTGAILAFSISRYVGKAPAHRLAGQRLQRADDWIAGHGFRAVLYARLAPGVPYTVVNYAAGLTSVSLASFAAATAIGVAPRAFAYTALGGNLGNLTSPEALAAFGIIAAMAIAGVLIPLRSRRHRD